MYLSSSAADNRPFLPAHQLTITSSNNNNIFPNCQHFLCCRFKYQQHPHQEEPFSLISSGSRIHGHYFRSVVFIWANGVSEHCFIFAVITWSFCVRNIRLYTYTHCLQCFLSSFRFGMAVGSCNLLYTYSLSFGDTFL